MRKDISNWWKQANIDYDNAIMNYDNGAYYVAVFLCQQAVEKSLKAYYMLVNKETPERTHSLVFLAKSCDIPESFIDFLASLTPEFITTRYPDAAGDLPANIYTENNAKSVIDDTGKFLKWLKDRIEKQ